MAEETNPSRQGVGFSRRSFLKSGGGLAAGAALFGLPASAELRRDPLTGLYPRVEVHYTCPIEGKTYTSYDDLRAHFAASHQQEAVPGTMPLEINGTSYDLQIEPHWTLQHLLQFELGLTGSAKTMCDRGACGACTVLIDDKPALSCSVLAVECEGKSIETIEGIAADPHWTPLIHAWMKWEGSQCGYCTPGQIVMAKYLLSTNPNPSEDDINQLLAGNLCRCGTYLRHVEAIQEAIEQIGEA